MSDEDKEKTTEKPSFINKAADIAAYPVSIAAGAFTFVSSVNDKLYDTLKKNETGLREELDKNKEFFKNEIAKDLTGTAGSLSELHKKNTKTYNDKLKNLGFTNFYKKLNGLHVNQKVDSAIMGFTASGVGLGVLLTIANSKGLMEKVNSHDKEKSPETQLAR